LNLFLLARAEDGERGGEAGEGEGLVPTTCHKLDDKEKGKEAEKGRRK